MKDNVLKDLQEIEAGHKNGLSSETQSTIARVRLLEHSYPRENKCTICDEDIIILHHINIYNGIRKYAGDTKSKWEDCIGQIWICPNCHHRIHIGNPLFSNGGSALEQRRKWWLTTR